MYVAIDWNTQNDVWEFEARLMMNKLTGGGLQDPPSSVPLWICSFKNPLRLTSKCPNPLLNALIHQVVTVRKPLSGGQGYVLNLRTSFKRYGKPDVKRSEFVPNRALNGVFRKSVGP